MVAPAPHGEWDGDRWRRDYIRLRDASRKLIEAAKANIETAQTRLEQARNIVQALWLWPALRQRHRDPSRACSPTTTSSSPSTASESEACDCGASMTRRVDDDVDSGPGR
jgi:hypothetical protein